MPAIILVEFVGLHPAARIPMRDVASVFDVFYLGVMRAFLAGFREMGCVALDATVTEINGPIGFMRRDLRCWLEDNPSPPSPS